MKNYKGSLGALTYPCFFPHEITEIIGAIFDSKGALRRPKTYDDHPIPTCSTFFSVWTKQAASGGTKTMISNELRGAIN